MSDWDLLRQYVQDTSQEAFAQLVRRHLAMVYATARRAVGDGHLAEDISQAVFLVLARKAATLRPPLALAGWLFRVT